jgi:predicted N-acyltransferase
MHVAQPTRTLDVSVTDTIASVGAAEWNALTGRDDPFLEHEFLRALEVSGAVGADTRCEPRYLLARDGAKLVGALPFFIKWDSYGEFIFDWAWAEAYQRAGIAYYPKIVVAAPYTPVSGPRLLIADGQPWADVANTLVSRLMELAAEAEMSSVHFLFVPKEECEWMGTYGFMPRLTHQFHWLNRGYTTFGDFLADLRSSKRKQVTKERAQVAASGLDIEVLAGSDVREEHVDALWRFYTANVERHWSQAYLNRKTFEQLAADFHHRLVVVLARDGQKWIGGAFNVRKNDGLYGRYWGALRDVPSLHFECCYYRLIEYAIGEGIRVFEAGAQGEHKFLRGFVARPIHSAHWIAHPGGRQAIRAFLDEERKRTAELITRYNSVSPLKYARAEAREG